MYKRIAILVLVIFLLSGCSNAGSPSKNAADASDGQATDRGDVNAKESPDSVSLSEEDYALFRELQDEKGFAVSQEYHEIQILTWKFARACLSGDKKAMEACLAADAEVSETVDIFDDNLEFLILRGLENKDGKYIADYEFMPKDEDSYSYINMEIVNENEEWKVDFYGFEK